MAWKEGPLPAATWNWGGVVTAESQAFKGFYFADFWGSYVKIHKPGGVIERVEAADVVLYDNSLELPPGAVSRAADVAVTSPIQRG
jgi:hypothetical protein